MSKNIFRTKSINQFLSETKQDGGMNRVLGTFGLTMLGIGCIVGTGIFVLTGIAAANYSGPALVISFIIAALACGCAALCYSEFAAMIPVAGSAYTYGYVALGEFWAWIIGWDLILEYTLALSAVSIGWSGYFGNILTNLGLALPKEFITAPEEGGLINLPAMAIIWIITLINMKGITQSSLVNDIIVVIKLAVVGLFIALGISHVEPANWTPFMPYGWSGVFTGASVIFFAYIGFDAVSTAAEEVKNPQKDLPRGIILSLIICTILYRHGPVLTVQDDGRSCCLCTAARRLSLGCRCRLRRRYLRPHVGPSGHEPRPEPYPLRHVPRRPVAALLRSHQ